MVMPIQCGISVFAGLGFTEPDYLPPLAIQARSTGWQQSQYLAMQIYNWLRGQASRSDLNSAQRGYVDQSVSQWQNEWIQNQQMAVLEESQYPGITSAGKQLIGLDIAPGNQGSMKGLIAGIENQLTANINAYASASQETKDAGAALSKQLAEQAAAEQAASRHGTNYVMPDGTVIQFLPEDMSGEDPATVPWTTVNAPPALTPAQNDSLKNAIAQATSAAVNPLMQPVVIPSVIAGGAQGAAQQTQAQQLQQEAAALSDTSQPSPVTWGANIGDTGIPVWAGIAGAFLLLMLVRR